MKMQLIPAGSVGTLETSKKKIAPKYNVNTAVYVPIVRTYIRGSGEFVKIITVVLIEGKEIGFCTGFPNAD